MRGWIAGALGLLALIVVAVSVPAAAGHTSAGGPSNDVWTHVNGKPPKEKNGKKAELNPSSFKAYTLNRGRIQSLLAGAPHEKAKGKAKDKGLVLALPAPNGELQRFELVNSPVMEPGLAAKRSDIQTFSGQGIDDPAATIRADITPLGFHASVRSPDGAWYIDPYYHLDDSLYVTYYGRDDDDDPHGVFLERDGDELLSAADLSAADVPTGPVVKLRTYRLALLTDPSYTAFFGGPANVVPAKVTLINRVDQVYEDETAIRMVLIDDTDKLQLDTTAAATGANGPCGAAPCFTAAQIGGCASSTLTRNRIVIGQLVGASKYDIGHIGLGVDGGGVASLGVVGGNGKAQGCTGLPKPIGDFYAVDYVAHEMGHQFSGNHTFNGTQLNCSGSNRSAGASVEPGSGTSIMAYAGICQQDNLQPHSDPYWSQRSFTEITAYVTSSRAAINEVQTVSLRDFDTNGDSFRITYNGNQSAPIVRGTNYTTAAIATAIQGLTGGTVTVAGWAAGTFNDTGFQVTFSGTLAGQNIGDLGLADLNGATGFVGETAKGGPIQNGGLTAVDTDNHAPVTTTGGNYTIPIRTPFALTGGATDSDGDSLTYMWEQNDRGAATGTALVNNTKTNGPLFRQFGVAALVSATDTLLTPSPGENAVDSNPTRVFPDMAQILANNTNAATGTCPTAPPAPTVVPLSTIDCFSEFLPTAAYTGATVGTFSNASPPRLDFRLTARDAHAGGGGIGFADSVLTLAPAAGPFLVTSQGAGTGTLAGASSQLVAWNVAGTTSNGVNTANVKISLSDDGGFTYPYVLAAETANDGSETVTLPNAGIPFARIKVEAVGNVFFDVNDASFAITAVPVVTNDAPAAGAPVQYSDALSPTVTVTANDPDTVATGLSAVASGLPAGLSLVDGSSTDGATLPGIRTWTVSGNTTAAPGTYPVTVTVTDDASHAVPTTFSIVVGAEDADATYAGDMLAFTAPGGSTANVLLRAIVDDRADGARGDITRATVMFKEGATVLCGPLAVAALNGDTTKGVASCTKALGVDAHTITIVVGGSYTGTTSSLVEVAQPDGSFVTGGGFRALSNSGGTYKADDGSRMHFVFNVKYTKNSKNVQGHSQVLFRAGGKTYQIKSTAIDSLGLALKTPGGTTCSGPPSSTCFGLASFRSKANLTDVTNPLAPVSLGGALSLEITITDKGEPGSNDTIGVTLWRGSELLFSSAWAGSATTEGTFDGGNAVVH